MRIHSCDIRHRQPQPNHNIYGSDWHILIQLDRYMNSATSFRVFDVPVPRYCSLTSAPEPELRPVGVRSRRASLQPRTICLGVLTMLNTRRNAYKVPICLLSAAPRPGCQPSFSLVEKCCDVPTSPATSTMVLWRGTGSPSIFWPEAPALMAKLPLFVTVQLRSRSQALSLSRIRGTLQATVEFW